MPVDRWTPTLLFLVVFGYLLFCAAPDLYWGDSAEMAAVSCDMGVAHSPGYPLFVMVSRLFGALPFETYPFRINIMSAFLAALAVVLIYRLATTLIGGSRIAGVVAAIGLMGCREFVKYGLYAEVYALHMALFAGVMLLVAGHYRRGGDLRILFALLLAGIGLAHHIMMVFVLGGVLFYMLIAPGHRLRIAAGAPLLLCGAGVVLIFRTHESALQSIQYIQYGLYALAAVFVVYTGVVFWKEKNAAPPLKLSLGALLLPALGALLFVFIPFASARQPVSDWWAPGSAANFFSLLLVEGYKSTFPTSGIEWLQRLNLMGVLLQVPVLVMLVALPGLVYLLWKKTRIGLLLLVFMAVSFAGSLFVSHGKPDALRLPVYASIYLMAGVGAGTILGWRFLQGGALKTVLRLAAVAAVGVVLAMNLADSDMRHMNRSGGARRLAESIFEQARPGSFLFIGANSPSIMGYMESCEPAQVAGKDIAIIPVSFLPFEWKLDQLKRKYTDVVFPDPPPEWSDNPIFRIDDPLRAAYAVDLLDSNRKKTGVYSDFQFLTEEYDRYTIPHGAVYQLVPADVSIERIREMVETDEQPQWDEEQYRDVTSATNIASVYNERGKIYLEHAFREMDEALVRRGLDEFRTALEILDAALDMYSRALRVEKAAIDTMNNMFGGDEDEGGAEPEIDVDIQLDLAKESAEEEKWRIFYGQLRGLLDLRAEVMSNRGQCRIFYGQSTEGLELMQRAIRLSPLNPRLYEALATAYYRTQSAAGSTKAIALWTAVTKLDPNNARAYHNIGSALVGIRQLEKSIPYYTQALAIDPTYKSAYVNLGRVFNKLGNCAMAATTLEEAKKQLPEDLTIRSELAQQYAECGMKHLYAREVETMMEEFPRDEKLYYTLGIIFRNGRQAANLARAIDALKELDPDFPVRTLFTSMQDCREVIPLVEEVLEYRPDDPYLMLELSLRHGMCGEVDQAVGVMEEIVERFPELAAAEVLLERMKDPEAEHLVLPDLPDLGDGAQEYDNMYKRKLP